jgi:hypothetical protein
MLRLEKFSCSIKASVRPSEPHTSAAGGQRNVLTLSMDGVTGKREETLAAIPKALQEHINTARRHSN